MRELYATVIDEAGLAALRAEAGEDDWLFAPWLREQDAPGDWDRGVGPA